MSDLMLQDFVDACNPWYSFQVSCIYKCRVKRFAMCLGNISRFLREKKTFHHLCTMNFY